MNYFYAPPEAWNEDQSAATIEGQEARHIAQVLRHKTGDRIYVSDGEGSRFECEISEAGKKYVRVKSLSRTVQPKPAVSKVIALGSVKKRDRLEFAVEKAVELDAWEVCLFNADHSERSRLKRDRLEAVIASAFKQCGRFWLPQLVILDSLDEVLSYYREYQPYMAHLSNGAGQRVDKLAPAPKSLLLVGPEGGFSERELSLNEEHKGIFVELGLHRLRAETAVTAFLSNFLFTSEAGRDSQ